MTCLGPAVTQISILMHVGFIDGRQDELVVMGYPVKKSPNVFSELTTLLGICLGKQLLCFHPGQPEAFENPSDRLLAHVGSEDFLNARSNCAGCPSYPHLPRRRERPWQGKTRFGGCSDSSSTGSAGAGFR